MLIRADKVRAADWPFPNFRPHELACRCGCGVFFFDYGFMFSLQALRSDVGRPIRVNSGHRCGVHNARVGGAVRSAHRHLAVDIDLHGHDRLDLAKRARVAGFTGFGYYQHFLHLDMGRARFWYSGERARQLWAL